MSPEAVVAEVVSDLVIVVEACGAAIIAVGAVVSFVRLLYLAAHRKRSAEFVPVRLTLGRYLTLGLEFQLAADVLRTAVAPTFRDIAQLAAIAAIRTALNYFLSKEIAEERRQVAAGTAGGVGGPTAPGGPSGPDGPASGSRMEWLWKPAYTSRFTPSSHSRS